MDRGPAGAETSSLNNSSAGCHRQLECSTGMTEGVSNHKNIPPNLSQHHPFPSTCLLVDPHPQALIPQSEVTGQLRQMARSCLVVKTQQVLRCQKATSHFFSLSLSHIFTTISPLQALATLTTGGKSRALQGLVCYQRTPALK